MISPIASNAALTAFAHASDPPTIDARSESPTTASYPGIASDARTGAEDATAAWIRCGYCAMTWKWREVMRLVRCLMTWRIHRMDDTDRRRVTNARGAGEKVRPRGTRSRGDRRV
jgi:hypothetical protein